MYDGDPEADSALSPSACPFPRCGREPGLTEMEGSLFDSAPGGLLIVSKWSPPATALIIRDPGAHVRRPSRGGSPGLVCCLCVSSQEKEKKR